MTRGELQIIPIYNQDECLTGVRTDALSYGAMESILSTVQNIAENRSPESVLDGGEALRPAGVYELRESMWNSRHDAETSDDRLGFQDVVTSTKATGYIALLQSTPRNKGVFDKAERKGLLYQPQPTPPIASGLATAEPTRGRYFLNKKIETAKAVHQQAMTEWFQSDQLHERRLMQRRLTISRGFEAALAIDALIRNSHQ